MKWNCGGWSCQSSDGSSTFFSGKTRKAKEINESIKQILKGWRSTANKYQIPRYEQELMGKSISASTIRLILSVVFSNLCIKLCVVIIFDWLKLFFKTSY